MLKLVKVVKNVYTTQNKFCIRYKHACILFVSGCRTNPEKNKPIKFKVTLIFVHKDLEKWW